MAPAPPAAAEAAASKPAFTFTTKLQPPPILSHSPSAPSSSPDGSSNNKNSPSSIILEYPTPSNPRPSTNPAIFTDAMIVRDKVFVQEQGCSAEAEIDADDARSWHWVVYASPDTDNNNNNAEANMPVAVIRLVPPPHAPHETLHNPDLAESESLPKYDLHHEPYIKITRVAVLFEFRGYGLCRMLMETVHEWAAQHAEEINTLYEREVSNSQSQQDVSTKGWTGLVIIHAQVQVERMYRRFGYETDLSMGTWEEEGIKHVGMFKRLEVVTRA